MAENKTVRTKASVSAFIAGIADETRRADAKVLAKLIGTATGAKPAMWGTAIVGFGSYHYKHDSGREGDMPIVGFSPRKAASVLYLSSRFDGGEALLARIGKFTRSKACIYIKRLSDIDLKALEKLIVASAASRGLKKPRVVEG